MTQRIADGPVDLITFELLQRIAETGSLSAAAAAMGVSQQAASSRMRTAERALGVVLVARSGTGSSLTEHGAMVLEWGVPVLEAARRAAAAIEALRGGAAPLTVAASQTVAEFLLPGWLEALRRRAPDVRVRLRSGNSEDVVAAVRSGAAQLGFVEGPDGAEGVHRVVLGPDELVVVVPAAHGWSGREVSVQELAATPLVLREQGSGTRAALESWASEQGVVLAAPAAELGTASAIRAAVRSLRAPAVLSRVAVADDVAAGRLAIARLAGPPIRRVFSAVWTTPLLPSAAEALLLAARDGA